MEYCGSFLTVVDSFKRFLTLQVLVPEGTAEVEIRLTFDEWKNEEDHYCRQTENRRIWEHTLEFSNHEHLDQFEFTFYSSKWLGRNHTVELEKLPITYLTIDELKQKRIFERFFNSRIVKYIDQCDGECNSYSSFRKIYTSIFGWIEPPTITSKLRRFLNREVVLEIFAGNGYWAYRLGFLAHWIATDSYAWGYSDHFVPILKFDALKAVQKFPAQILAIIYPPFNEDLALLALQQFKGSKIIYAGPKYQCATPAFHQELKSNWQKDSLTRDIFLYTRR